MLGHPYVDVWAAVKPDRSGATAGPTCPAGRSGSRACASAGLAARTQADTRGLAAHPGEVGSYADLEPALLGRVEELIDFVTA